MERGGARTRLLAGSVEVLLQITCQLRCADPRHPLLSCGQVFIVQRNWKSKKQIL